MWDDPNIDYSNVFGTHNMAKGLAAYFGNQAETLKKRFYQSWDRTAAEIRDLPETTNCPSIELLN